MNKAILLGRIVNDPEVHYQEGGNTVTIARYRLAVNRRYHKEGEAEADFITCVAFGKNAEVAQKYFKKGLIISVSGRIRTGSYTNSEGRTVYTTEVYIEEQEFAESKKSGQSSGMLSVDEAIPDDIDQGLPWEG